MMRGIGGGAGGDHLRLELDGVFREDIVVDDLGLLADAVVGDLEEAAGEIGLIAVGEMAAVGEIHGQDAVAGLEDGEVDGHVRLAAGVGLDVDVLGAEELPGAVDGELLDDVHVLATAVPAAPGVALGVFIGEAGALGFHHGAGGEILRGDELDVLELALCLVPNGVGDLGIGLGEGGVVGSRLGIGRKLGDHGSGVVVDEF